MRIVIKVGTSIISGKNGKLNSNVINRLCITICHIQDLGHEVILVSSGAVGLGACKAGYSDYPCTISEKQALASIGQCELMYMYAKTFEKLGKIAAQLLLTRDVTEKKISRQNVINTVNNLLAMNAVPIVNENDSVSTDELGIIDSINSYRDKSLIFGDNDILSALVAEMINADCLVILTDTDGLYEENPKNNPNAKKVCKVSNIQEYIDKVSLKNGSAFSTGGMYTKLLAVRYSLEAGIKCYISYGGEPEKIEFILKNQDIGTVFIPSI